MIKDDEDEDDPLYDDNVDHANGNGSYGAQNNDDDSEVEIVEDESADDTTHLVVERRRGRPKQIDKDNTKRTNKCALNKRKIRQPDFYAPLINKKLGQPMKDFKSSFDSTLVEGVVTKSDKGETECSPITERKRGRPTKSARSSRKSADKEETECSSIKKRKCGQPTKSAHTTPKRGRPKKSADITSSHNLDRQLTTQQYEAEIMKMQIILTSKGGTRDSLTTLYSTLINAKQFKQAEKIMTQLMAEIHAITDIQIKVLAMHLGRSDWG